MAVNLGSAYGAIEVDFSSVQKSTQAAQNLIKGFGEDLDGLLQKLSAIEGTGLDTAKIEANMGRAKKAADALSRSVVKARETISNSTAPAGEEGAAVEKKRTRTKKAEKVEVDTTQAEQKLQGVADALGKVEQKIADVSNQQLAFSFPDAVDINTLKAQEKLKALEDLAQAVDNKIEAQIPQVDVDTAEAEKQVDGLEQKVEKVGKKRGRKPKVEVDTTEAEKRVDGLDQKVEQTTKRSRKKTKIEADTADAEQKAENLGKKVQGLPLDRRGRLGVDTSEAEAKVTTLSQKLDALKQKLDNIGSTMQSVGTQLSMAVTAPIALAGGAAIKTAAEFEQLEVAFTVMLGSAEKAKQLIEDIKAFSAATPFQFSDIQEATKILIAFGSTQEEVFGEMQGLGDIAAGTGAPLKELALLYGKARASQTLYTMDLMELANRGVPIFTELAKIYGVTEAQVKKMAENGQLHFTDLQKVIQNLTGEGGRFAGLMEAQSKTLSGLFSTLKDNIELALGDIGAAIIDTFDLKGKLAGAIEILEAVRLKISEFVKTNPEMAKMVFIFAGIAAAIGPVLVALGGLTTVMGTVVGGLATLAGVFSGPVIVAIFAAGAALYGLITNFDRVKIAVEDMVNTIGQQFGSLNNTFGGNLGTIVGMMAGAVESVAGYGSQLMSVFADGITSAVGYVVDALQYLGSTISYWLQPHSPPKLLPNLDLWGKKTADVYLEGWEKADYDILRGFGSDIERILKTAVDLDQMGELDANKALLSLRETMANAIEQINQTGSVSPEFFDQIKQTAGVAGEEVATLAELYLKQAQAQEQVKKAQEQVASATEKLTNLQLNAAKQAAGGGRKGKMSEQMRQQIRAAQNEKAAAEQQLALAEEQSSEAENELAIFQERLGVAQETRDLLAEQLKILEDMAKAGEEFGKKLAGAGKAALKAITDGLGELGNKLKNPGQGMPQKTFWDDMTDGLETGRQKWQEILDNFRNENGEIDIAIILGKATGVDIEKLQERFDSVRQSADKMKDAVMDVGERIYEALSPVIEQSLPDLQKAFDELKLMLDPLSSIFSDIFAVMSEVAVNALYALGGVISIVLGGIIRAVTAGLPGIIKAMRGSMEIFAGVIKLFRNIFGVVYDIITGNIGTEQLLERVNGMKEGIWQILTGMWNVVTGIFSSIYNTITGFIEGAVVAALNYFFDFETDATLTWDNIKQAITTSAMIIKEQVIDWITKMVVDAILWFEDMKVKAGVVWDNIKTTITEKVGLLIEAVSLSWENFKTWWGETLASLLLTGSTKWQEIKEAINTKVTEIQTELTTKITELLDAWKDLYDQMKAAVTDKFGFIITAVSDKLTEVLETVRGFVAQFVAAGGELINGIRDGFVAGVAGFINAVYDAMTGAEEAASEGASGGGDKNKGDRGNEGSSSSSNAGASASNSSASAGDAPPSAGAMSANRAVQAPADTVATIPPKNAPVVRESKAVTPDPQLAEIAALLKDYLSTPSSVTVVLEGGGGMLQSGNKATIEAMAEQIADIIQRRRFR